MRINKATMLTALSIGPAARRIGCSDQWVRTLIARRELAAIKTTLGYLIDASDIERLRAEHDARKLASVASEST